jgi:hypothetical protein
MAKHILTFVSCVLFSLVACSPPIYGQSCRLAMADDSDPEMWLEGVIGDSKVRVYLSSEPDGKLTGSFYDLNDWSPVSLEGTRGTDCRIRIVERRATHATSPLDGTWEGTFRNLTFEGVRRDLRSEGTAAIRLQRVPPMNCDGRGKWVKFSDPRFSISFEYPEGWRLEENEKQLRLLCPDPMTLQFGDTGVTVESIAGTTDLERIGIFRKYKEKWFVSDFSIVDCEPPGGFCDDAGISRHDGMTVVHGSGSTRLYRVGDNYQGLGEEEAYVLLMKDRTLYVSGVMVKKEATARIVRSARPVSAARQ